MRLVTIMLAVLVTAGVPAPLSADDAPKRSAELQVLDRFIGEWETVVTNKTTGQTFNTVESRRWSRLGEFVLSEDQNLSTKKEAHFLITYDPNAKVYRACFIEEAGAALLLGTWDNKAQMMKWTSPPEVSAKFTGTHRIIDKDHTEWSMKVTGSDGKVFVELSGKQSRRK
jgi:hypothetical protein